MSSEFGPRSHAFDNRSFSSADNSPISSPAIHDNHRVLSTIESVANISYKTPIARTEQYKQSYFDDHTTTAESTRPALPVTASWAKSVSGSSTPTMRYHHTQDLDVTSDNFGPSLAAAVALAQKSNNQSNKANADNKELKKAKRAAEQTIAGKLARSFQQLQNEADMESDTEGTGDDDGLSDSGSMHKVSDPLVYFVLGMDATDMSVPSIDEPSASVGIRALRDEAVTGSDTTHEEEQMVQTGITFLKSNIRYNTSNPQHTFDPWTEQTIPQSAKRDFSEKGSPIASGYRSPRREQATSHASVDNASPKMVSATSHIHSPSVPSKQVFSDMSSRSASLLSALQPHVEQHSVRSTQLNAPPGIPRQPLHGRPESPQAQSKTISLMSNFSNLAVLNGTTVNSSSPRLQHLPPNLPLSQNIHEGKIWSKDTNV
jgi:hypothetical protein